MVRVLSQKSGTEVCHRTKKARCDDVIRPAPARDHSVCFPAIEFEAPAVPRTPDLSPCMIYDVLEASASIQEYGSPQ